MKISAGQVLTKQLLDRVNKAAYQHGGFEVVGGINKKSATNLHAKTIVNIPRKYVKGDLKTFVEAYGKTMNSWYYHINFI